MHIFIYKTVPWSQVVYSLEDLRPNVSFGLAGKYISLPDPEKTHHCHRQVPFGGAQLQRNPMIVFLYFVLFCLRDVLVRYVYRRHVYTHIF